MTEIEREALREEIETAMRPAVDQVLANATRPWRRIVVWLAIAYLVLLTASIVEWWVTP